MTVRQHGADPSIQQCTWAVTTQQRAQATGPPDGLSHTAAQLVVIASSSCQSVCRSAEAGSLAAQRSHRRSRPSSGRAAQQLGTVRAGGRGRTARLRGRRRWHLRPRYGTGQPAHSAAAAYLVHLHSLQIFQTQSKMGWWHTHQASTMACDCVVTDNKRTLACVHFMLDQHGRRRCERSTRMCPSC